MPISTPIDLALKRGPGRSEVDYRKNFRSPARWGSFFAELAKLRFRPPLRPFKLTFVITKECHSRCLNCSIWKIKPHNELTLEEIRTLAKNSPFLSWVHFIGGEPTDRPDFVDVVMAFYENCPRMVLAHFPTNGLKPKRIDEMVQSIIARGLPKITVTVSIDGPQELNDTLRGIPRDFERAVETFQRLRKHRRVKALVGMTLYESNMALVEETFAELQKRIPGFQRNDLHLNLPQVSSHYYGNVETGPSILPQMVDAVESHNKKRAVSFSPVRWVEGVYESHVRNFVTTNVTPLDCASLSASCFLAEDGTVYPCSIWDRPLGNIRDHDLSLEPILELASTKAVRQQIEKKDCPNCWTPCEAYQSILVDLARGKR